MVGVHTKDIAYDRYPRMSTTSGPKELTLVEPLTRLWDKPSRSPPCCNCGCALKSPYGETWQQPEIPQPVGMVETQADEADDVKNNVPRMPRSRLVP